MKFSRCWHFVYKGSHPQTPTGKCFANSHKRQCEYLVFPKTICNVWSKTIVLYVCTSRYVRSNVDRNANLFSTGGLHSPCIWFSHPAGCSLQPSLGGQTLCLRGTSCHQQPLGRTEATDEAALHTVGFWRVMEVANQRITTYIALHEFMHNLKASIGIETEYSDQTFQQCCLTNWI